MTLNRIAHERVGGGKEGESHSVCRQLQTRTEASRGSFLLDIHKIRNFFNSDLQADYKLSSRSSGDLLGIYNPL